MVPLFLLHTLNMPSFSLVLLGKGVFSRANTAQAISSINRVNAIATLPRTKKRHKVKAESTLGKDKKINWFFFGKAKSWVVWDSKSCLSAVCGSFSVHFAASYHWNQTALRANSVPSSNHSIIQSSSHIAIPSVIMASLYQQSQHHSSIYGITPSATIAALHEVITVPVY